MELTARLARWAAALLLLAAGCEAEIPACPGAVQGTLTLTGTTASDPGATTCRFPLVTSFELIAAVAWIDASTAAVCIQRPLAVTRRGPRSGDAFTVQVPLPQASLASCPCPVDVLETLDGTLLRTAGSTAVGFRGTLVERFTRSASAGTCYLGADAVAVQNGCPGETGCQAAYQVTTPAP